MEIGTAETITDAEPLRKRGSRLSSSSSSSPGSGGSGGDGPDDGSELPEFPVRDQAEAVPIDKSRYIAWFLLMAVGMTFAGLLGAYLMIATNKAAEWKPFDLPVQIWISTAIILASSVTYWLGKRGIDSDSFLVGRK